MLWSRQLHGLDHLDCLDPKIKMVKIGKIGQDNLRFPDAAATLGLCAGWNFQTPTIGANVHQISFHAISAAMTKRKGKGHAPVPAPSTPPQATTSRITCNPVATISDGTTHTLWCLVEGESIVFEVTAPANASINRLKELIREKGINVSKHAILAKDLVLLKVSPF